MVYAVQDR
jgi:hypothetical protein